MNRRAVYPGSFDPITNGHLHIALQAASMFECLVVAVARSRDKNALFSLEERVALAEHVLKPYHNIEVAGFDGLLLDFMVQQQSSIIIRGLRVVSDFEYEFQLAMMNKRLNPNMETVLLMSPENSTFISASLVKEIAALGGDVSSLVDQKIYQALQNKLQQSN